MPDVLVVTPSGNGQTHGMQLQIVLANDTDPETLPRKGMIIEGESVLTGIILRDRGQGSEDVWNFSGPVRPGSRPFTSASLDGQGRVEATQSAGMIC